MSATIQNRVDDFNVGFTEQIGPELSGVFDGEQAALTAAGVPGGAVAAGDSLPDATVIDGRGDEHELSALLGDDRSVVVFYRGAWCPYCNITLKHYQQELLPALQEAGVPLIAVSPQTPEASETAVANGGLEFTVVTDPGNALARELGILTEPSHEARAAHTALGFDVADSNADGTAGIPFPTVLVVDGDGRILFADVHVDYTSRTEVPEILAAVRG